MNEPPAAPDRVDILDAQRLRAARRAIRRERRARRRRIAIAGLALALCLAFAIALLLWEDDGGRCAKEELIGTQEVCTRWETREGLHVQRVE